nr:protein SDA1 homolog [Onthophagus taurus]
MVRHNNQLPHNLPQLQNLIKRDPISYKEEFLQQYQHFQNTVEVFEFSPQLPNKTLEESSMFIAQVAQCYPEELRNFPQQLISLLEKHGTVLDSQVRMQICKALILLRNKFLLEAIDVFTIFFKLLHCQDKALRSFLETHIITDIKNTNAKKKNAKLNTALQNFMFTMLKDSNTKAAKMSIDIMIELYKKNVWNDTKTVNVLASACFSKITKVMVACLKFFLGKDEEEKSDDSDSEEEINPKEVMMANKFNKKTRKRGKQLDKVKKLAVKQKKKKSRAPIFNFSALMLVHDPQGMAEKLFKQLESSNQRFEVKLMMLDVISRLIGLHNLFLLNYYPYLQRFMQPHQREVTRILQFAAQATHSLVPPDVLEPLLKTIANNFITERNSSDVMAIGLNAVREICARCLFAMNEDLLQDLIQYRVYKERSVMMAAASLLQLYKLNKPEMLRKKDRGRPTEAIGELVPTSYGEINVKDYVPGAEVLLLEDKKGDDIEINSDSDSNDDEWVDVNGSDDEIGEEEDSDDDLDENNGDDDDEKVVKDAKSVNKKLTKEEILNRKKEMAQKATLERILTDEDFKRIEIANIRKQIQPTSKGLKRKLEETGTESSDLVKLGDIENIYKKRKHDKQARIDSVRAGQQGREKYGYKDNRLNIHCSKTNREKRKTKNFMMVKHKSKAKVKRSFKDKQIALRNHLLKVKRMK